MGTVKVGLGKSGTSEPGVMSLGSPRDTAEAVLGWDVLIGLHARTPSYSGGDAGADVLPQRAASELLRDGIHLPPVVASICFIRCNRQSPKLGEVFTKQVFLPRAELSARRWLTAV